VGEFLKDRRIPIAFIGDLPFKSLDTIVVPVQTFGQPNTRSRVEKPRSLWWRQGKLKNPTAGELARKKADLPWHFTHAGGKPAIVNVHDCLDIQKPQPPGSIERA
jgi:hypothetical protein